MSLAALLLGVIPLLPELEGCLKPGGSLFELSEGDVPDDGCVDVNDCGRRCIITAFDLLMLHYRP
jgi:hypothetical protein